jgi:hypothetical protein
LLVLGEDLLQVFQPVTGQGDGLLCLEFGARAHRDPDLGLGERRASLMPSPAMATKRFCCWSFLTASAF